MPGPFSMSGTLKMDRSDEPSAGDKGWLRKRSLESVANSGSRAPSPAVTTGANGGGGGGTSRGLDSQLWHACAGAMVHLPKVGAKVVYFPQGHAEHAASPLDFPRTLGLSCTIGCRVLCLQFLADTETDEVYARIRLQPDPSVAGAASDPPDDSPPSPPLPEKSASFAKTLTQSDANNGGGFSVPRYCAETIFPRLDYTEDPPVQIVHAKDVHGTLWKFRHIYRGTPRRHLLTTGWSNFVNQKKLVAGDAIVFLRSNSGELCVGVRRSTRGTIGANSTSWHLSSAGARPPSSRWEMKPPDNSFEFLGPAEGNTPLICSMRTTGSDIGSSANSFARNRARVTAKSVLEAATLAAAGQPFEVVYYPRASISEFCVKAHAVEAALQQSWTPGMRFKMAVETEDAPRISWFMGTIAKVQEADPIRWPNSPWKMLQVTWDEPDLLQGIVRVSPWQVELVSPMQLPPFPLPKKKLRSSQTSDLQLEGPGILGLPMAALANNMLGQINSWHGFVDSVPAGMQGARHDRTFGLAFHDLQPNMSQPGIFLESFYQHQEHPVVPAGARVSTELIMGNLVHQSHPGFPDHLSTLLTVGNSSSSEPASSSSALNRDQGGSTSTKSAPFVLFGKAIDTSQSAKSQPAQLSGGSSSDGHGHETMSDGNQSEVMDRMPIFLSGHGNSIQVMKTSSMVPQQGESLDSGSTEVGTLSWFKEQASILDKERAINFLDSAFNHCKVFRESDEVGRTVDLSIIDSYEELYEKLSMMFGVHKLEILNRVVYVDSMGSSRPIGDDPYREFVKRVKRLKILSESSSESMTR